MWRIMGLTVIESNSIVNCPKQLTDWCTDPRDIRFAVDQLLVYGGIYAMKCTSGGEYAVFVPNSASALKCDTRGREQVPNEGR